MIRLSNDNLGRALHAALYARLRTFCQQNTPEVPSEPFVNAVLSRLYNSDSSLHILVELDNVYNIIAHAVIDVQQAYGNTVIYAHQYQRDSPSVAAMDEFMEYLDKLAEFHNATCIAFSIVKNTKVFEKKYQYRTARSVMIKVPQFSEAQNTEGESGA
jgi:hypothetical protein